MTVKCLNKTDQSMIVDSFNKKILNQTELAEMFGVHRRTIQRVLIDYGVISYKTRGPKSVTPRVQVERNLQHARAIEQRAANA
jgi:plasmid maintenance system antidote protein VapI